VGNSVRTIDETVEAARSDITIMTNLLEARVLEGPADAFPACPRP